MKASKHLLVIRLSAMGDVAMTVPVLNALLQQYPTLKITVLTRSFFKPLFAQLPNVTVYEADVKGRHKGIFGLWRLYRELSKLQIDAVADLHHVLRSSVLKLFFIVGGYPFKQIDKGRAEKKALTAHNHKVFKPLKSTHQRYVDVFNSLQLPINLEACKSLSPRKLSNKTKAFIITNKKPIGIAPFAAFKGKMYPLELMQEVVAALNDLDMYQILLFGGGKKEQQQLDIWVSTYTNAVNVIGKITFDEELDLISNLDLMLAMDSGNAHLAAIFGIPTITLWGVTHPYAGFYPFGQSLDNALLADRAKYPLIPTSVYGNKIPEGYAEVMRTIQPKDIIEKIQGILQ